MPIIFDLTGQRFGRLTVTRQSEERVRKSKSCPQGFVAWLCRCDCGADVVRAGIDLKSGDTKSCGCLRAESNARLHLDLAGKKFGRLTVIRRAERRNNDPDYWLCRCDCGAEGVFNGGNLQRGTTKSCGCLMREQAIADLVGEKFGRLTVLRQSEKRGSGSAWWVCKCRCRKGRKVIVNTGRLTSGNTKSCGCLQREWLKKLNAKQHDLREQNKTKTDEKGKVWLAPWYAPSYSGFDRTTLRNWSDEKRGCPILDDAALLTRPDIEIPAMGSFTFYSKDSVDKARDALKELSPIPKYDGHVHFREAATTLAVHPRWLRTLMSVHGWKPVWKPGKSKHKHKWRFQWRAYIPATQFLTLRNESARGELQTEAAQPATEDEPPHSRRGRKTSSHTLELGKFCYDQLAARERIGIKRRQICNLVREEFGRILAENEVTIYAKRYVIHERNAAVSCPGPFRIL